MGRQWRKIVLVLREQQYYRLVLRSRSTMYSENSMVLYGSILVRQYTAMTWMGVVYGHTCP
jgi:hypothetical protein